MDKESTRGSLNTGGKLEEGKALASGDSKSEVLKECRDLEASGTSVSADEVLEGEASKPSTDAG